MYDYICIIIIIPSQSSWLTSINPIPSSNRRGSTGPAAFLAERALGTTFRCEGVWHSSVEKCQAPFDPTALPICSMSGIFTYITG